MLRLVTMEKEYSIEQEGCIHLDVSDCQMYEDAPRVKVQKEQTDEEGSEMERHQQKVWDR